MTKVHKAIDVKKILDAQLTLSGVVEKTPLSFSLNLSEELNTSEERDIKLLGIFFIKKGYLMLVRYPLSYCTTYGNRTRDSSVKGKRLNPLTNAAFSFFGSQR